MQKVTKVFLIALMCAGLAGLQACSDDGPLEEAGEALDEAADDVGDGIEDACEDLTDSNC